MSRRAPVGKHSISEAYCLRAGGWIWNVGLMRHLHTQAHTGQSRVTIQAHTGQVESGPCQPSPLPLSLSRLLKKEVVVPAHGGLGLVLGLVVLLGGEEGQEGVVAQPQVLHLLEPRLPRLPPHEVPVQARLHQHNTNTQHTRTGSDTAAPPQHCTDPAFFTLPSPLFPLLLLMNVCPSPLFCP